ncbi:hypothetical protein DFH06DRAFT_1473798 [Mycena polygramma]|nr:hypothetical protein DFH06DRAFT_1473798 [Mycena polygramma]
MDAHGAGWKDSIQTAHRSLELSRPLQKSKGRDTPRTISKLKALSLFKPSCSALDCSSAPVAHGPPTSPSPITTAFAPILSLDTRHGDVAVYAVEHLESSTSLKEQRLHSSRTLKPSLRVKATPTSGSPPRAAFSNCAPDGRNARNWGASFFGLYMVQPLSPCTTPAPALRTCASVHRWMPTTRALHHRCPLRCATPPAVASLQQLLHLRPSICARSSPPILRRRLHADPPGICARASICPWLLLLAISTRAHNPRMPAAAVQMQ